MAPPPSPAAPAEVLARLLQDLGVQAEDMPPDAGGRAARYRGLLAGRKMLVVLDDARDAAQVRPLLPDDPGCAAIITSCARLADLPGARGIGLGVLSDDESRELFARIVGEDRADAEPAATGRILRACSGLPLAIRIVAAKLAVRPGWSIRSAAGRLTAERGRLAELRAGDLAVRASFLLSYDLLDGPAARALQVLGLAPQGPLRLDAAAALLTCRRPAPSTRWTRSPGPACSRRWDLAVTRCMTCSGCSPRTWPPSIWASGSARAACSGS